MASIALQTEMLNRLTKGNVLVVHSQRVLKTSVRSVLRALGASSVFAMDTYNEALEAVKLRSYNYILFENSKGKGKTPAEFAKAINEKSPTSILIAMFEPAYVEDLFTCLQAGVRGFVVIPCTPGVLEATLLKATEGLNIPPALLEGDNWNLMFAKFVLKQLDDLCEVVQQSRENIDLVKQVKEQTAVLKDAVGLGRAHSQGGDQEFIKEIYSQCVNVAEDRRTRLAMVRERLAKLRNK